jgi:hypothetical protein
MKQMKLKIISIILLLVNFFPPIFSQNKIEIDIKTGADNLEPKDFMENPSIRLQIRNKPDTVLTNINRGQTWANNSQHRFTIPLTPDIAVTDISEIEITRKDKDGSKNNFEAAVADNWNIDKLLVTATFKKDGKTIKYQLLRKEGSPFIRFVYEKKGAYNPYETDNSIRYLLVDTKIISGAPEPTPADPNLVIAKPVKLMVEIGTGDDDLRGGGDNLSFKIFLKNNPTPLLWKNVNAGRQWNNYSVNLKEKTFNNLLDFDQIERIEMWHDGAGGMGADNWTVDKISIIAKQDARQKILADKVGAPVYRFTGDTRKLNLKVE